jgi:hypothetical protein
VECNFQDYKWYHGRVADLSEDGTTCEVLYHDKDVSPMFVEISIVTLMDVIHPTIVAPSR